MKNQYKNYKTHYFLKLIFFIIFESILWKIWFNKNLNWKLFLKEEFARKLGTKKIWLYFSESTENIS